MQAHRITPVLALAGFLLPHMATAAGAADLTTFEAKIDAAWAQASLGAGAKGVATAGKPLEQDLSIGAACLGTCAAAKN